MAGESLKKIPLSVILVVIAALVLSSVISFYLGRMDGEKQAQASCRGNHRSKHCPAGERRGAPTASEI